jgi:hypothetical protein
MDSGDEGAANQNDPITATHLNSLGRQAMSGISNGESVSKG